MVHWEGGLPVHHRLLYSLLSLGIPYSVLWQYKIRKRAASVVLAARDGLGLACVLLLNAETYGKTEPNGHGMTLLLGRHEAVELAHHIGCGLVTLARE